MGGGGNSPCCVMRGQVKHSILFNKKGYVNILGSSVLDWAPSSKISSASLQIAKHALNNLWTFHCRWSLVHCFKQEGLVTLYWNFFLLQAGAAAAAAATEVRRPQPRGRWVQFLWYWKADPSHNLIDVLECLLVLCQSASKYLIFSNARVMKAPDISSEVYFPSLGNSEDTAPKGAWGKNP